MISQYDITDAIVITRLYNDFEYFLGYVWECLGFVEPDRAQKAMAHFLADIRSLRKMLMAFRGVGKTYVTAAYVVWRLFRNPDLKIVIVSASGGYAEQISKFIRQIIGISDLLKHLEPRQDQTDTTCLFTVGPAKIAKDPSVKSIGIFGQLAGSRADIVIADDIETPTTSETETMRLKLEERTKEFADLLGDREFGEIIYLGTPQVPLSFYLKLPDRGFKIKIWPARYPDPKLQAIYGDKLFDELIEDLNNRPELGTLHGETVGAPTDPERFNHEFLLKKWIDVQEVRFQMQYMLNTSPSDIFKFQLKLSNLMFMSLDLHKGPQTVIYGADEKLEIETPYNTGLPGDKLYKPRYIDTETYIRYTQKVMVIDPSGRGRDETSYVVLAELNGLIFVLDVGGYIKGFVPEVLEDLALKAKQFSVNLVKVESNFGDGMFKGLFQPVLYQYHSCGLEEYKVSGQKEKRIISALKPVIDQHRLIFNRNLIEDDFTSPNRYAGLSNEDKMTYRLFYQLTRLTEDKGCLIHDDRVDALAEGCRHFQPHLHKDSKKEARQSDIQNFINSVGEVDNKYGLGNNKEKESWSWMNRFNEKLKDMRNWNK